MPLEKIGQGIYGVCNVCRSVSLTDLQCNMVQRTQTACSLSIFDVLGDALERVRTWVTLTYSGKYFIRVILSSAQVLNKSVGNMRFCNLIG